MHACMHTYIPTYLHTYKPAYVDTYMQYKYEDKYKYIINTNTKNTNAIQFNNTYIRFARPKQSRPRRIFLR